MKLSRLATVFLVAAGLATTQATTLLFDRERMPAVSITSVDPTRLLGDDFIIQAPGLLAVSTIRTWFTVFNSSNDPNDPGILNGISFWLSGPDSPNVSQQNFGYSATVLDSTSFRTIWQIDWNVGGLILEGEKSYNFALGAPWSSFSVAIAPYNIPTGDNHIKVFDGGGNLLSTSESNDLAIQIFGPTAVGPDPVPEPFTMALVGGALVAALRKRKRSA